MLWAGMVRNDNGGRFVDFQHEVTWQHPSGRHANQIDHLAISRRFGGCFEDKRNRNAADIGNLRDHHLMVAMMRLRNGPSSDHLLHRSLKIRGNSGTVSPKC